MIETLKVGGNIAALLGLIICIVAGATRLMGEHYALGFETITLFNGGAVLLVVASLAKLELLLLLHKE